MADVITRFRLETTQYDSALRKEAQRLTEFAAQASKAGNQFGQLANKNAEAARSLGTMAASATNAKDKVKELVNAYNTFANQYNALTKEQQQTDFAKAMADSLVVLKGRISEAKQELYGLDSAAKQVKASASGNAGFDQLLGGFAGKFGMSASMFTGVGAAVAAAGTAFKAIQENVQTAIGFEQSMSRLSSLTGMVGKDLDQLKEYAIELGASTTLTASQVADAFRLIGSQQPQLLASGEALKEVTKYAITLSEAAGIDLATASQTLSTSINQMGGDSKNAARYVNVLAAASQKGAGDIAWLGEAIVKSGTYAKAVGASYEELTANLEILAKAGYDAGTAGTALRSIILALEKQADSDLRPSVVGLTQAFENLGQKHLDISGYAAIVNQRFAAQAMILAENAQQTRDMTEAITGTNIAEQQAETNVNNLSGALKQLSSAWEGLNLHINDSNGPITSFVNELTTTVRQVDVLTTKIKGLGDDFADNEFFNFIKNYAGSGLKWWTMTIPGVAPVAGGKWVLDKIIGDPTQNSTTPYDRNTFQNPLSNVINQFRSSAPATTTEDNDVIKKLQSKAEDAIKSISELQAELKTLKKLRDEAANSGNVALRDQYNKQIASVQAEIKSLRGGGNNTNKTPQDRAANIVQSAQESYAQTMIEASLRMEAGLDDTLSYKKKELQAQEQLFAAYGKAYATYSDPKYKEAYDSAAAAYKQLAEEVKAETALHEADKEAVKMLAAAEKQYADVMTKVTSWQKPTQTGIGNYISGMQKSLNGAELGSIDYQHLYANIADATAYKNLMQVAIQQGLDEVVIDSSPLWQQIINMEDIPNSTWSDIVSTINQKLKDAGIDKVIGIDLKTGKTSDGKNQTTAAKSNETVIGLTQKMSGGISSIVNGIEGLGVELPKGMTDILGGIQTVTTILTGISTLVSAIEIITAADAAIPFFAQGGVVRAAGGWSGVVPGNHLSGDQVPALVNSGETILTAAQAGNLNTMLQDGSRGVQNAQSYVEGEKIWLGVNNFLRRSGRGEIVTSRR